jgi:Flp pilus assembly protein CpaB
MNQLIIYTIVLLCLVAAVGVLGVLFVHHGFFYAPVNESASTKPAIKTTT